MTFSDIPLMAMLKGKMGYVSQRQSLIAQNVANADTPGYVPKDSKPFQFGDALQLALRPAAASASMGGLSAPTGAPAVPVVRTNAMHLESSAPQASALEQQTKEDSEIRLDGNNVVLEDQMVKLGAARMDFDAAVGFYQQSMNMLKSALKKPGS